MLDKIFFLIKNNASLQVIYLFLKQKIKNIFVKNQIKSFKKKNQYYLSNKKISNDYFSMNAFNFHKYLKKYKKNFSYLEIGSYEGLSTVFFLSILKNSKIYCVDPFIDFEENKDKDFNKVLKNFKHNTQKFESRIRLSKSTSDDFFLQEIDERFDLIYIDGNHHADNVYKDSINSFKLLKLSDELDMIENKY